MSAHCDHCGKPMGCNGGAFILARNVMAPIFEQRQLLQFCGPRCSVPLAQRMLETVTRALAAAEAKFPEAESDERN